MLKRIFLLGLIALLPASVTPSTNDAVFESFRYQGMDEVFSKPLKASQFQNPIIAGFYPDPSIVKVQDDFYMVHSTFSYYPGIPIFHSRDLVNWKQLGNVIDRPDMLKFDGMALGNQGVYAPTIEYNDGTFYVINTCVGCGGNFIVTAKDPKGPWSQPIWLPKVGGIDPSLFFENGRVWILNNDGPKGEPEYAGHRAIWIREVDPKTFQPITEQKLIVDKGSNPEEKPIWVEGPHLYKVNGWYYLSVAEGGTEINHSQVVFRSKEIMGKYSPNPKNPIMTQRHLDRDRKNAINSTGHADMFQDPKGNWWAVFLATRTYAREHFNTGRETFLLPVKWKNGWPTILKGKQKVGFRPTRPRFLRERLNGRPLTGNFRYSYDFKKQKLGSNWLFVRIPKEPWWKFDENGLRIKPRNQRIGDLKQPSVIAHRLHHTKAAVSTTFRFEPKSVNEEAGLAAIQQDGHFLTYGVGLNREGKRVLRVRHKEGKDFPKYGKVLFEKELKNLPKDLRLSIQIDRSNFEFKYAEVADEWQTVFNLQEIYTLSTVKSGGFLGATIGMYAEGEHQ